MCAQPVRGKKTKAAKAKTKYGDQDEEDRELAMQFLASAGNALSRTQCCAVCCLLYRELLSTHTSFVRGTFWHVHSGQFTGPDDSDNPQVALVAHQLRIVTSISCVALCVAAATWHSSDSP